MNAKDRRKDKRRYVHLHKKIRLLEDVIDHQEEIIVGFHGSFWTRLKLVFRP